MNAVAAPAELVVPDRRREIARHLAWVDHRLRERRARLSLEEIALLFLLHIAADRQADVSPR